MSEPVRGGIYRVRSRNLTIAVYNGNDGFIGIREKFGTRSLFTEYKTGSDMHGTVRTWERIGIVPNTVSLTERDPDATSTCQACGLEAWWTGPPAPAPWACKSGCDNVLSYAPRQNQRLFEILDGLS